MLLFFISNTVFFKFMKLNILTSLSKMHITFSHLSQTIMLSLQFLKGKTCVKSVIIISELTKHFFFVFFVFVFHCRECYELLGSNHADVLVVFHVFTGCGVIRRFLGESKALWWKTFKLSSQEELRALAALGEYETLPSARILEGNI